MQEIEKLRHDVDQIHNELTRLFRQRLEITEQIWKIKQTRSLPFFDLKREEEIIHRFDDSISSIEEKKAVQNFLRSILKETKNYLEVKLK
jgi:chorismate mutase